MKLVNIRHVDLVTLLDYCPQLISISTWCTDQDVQAFLHKRVKGRKGYRCNTSFWDELDMVCILTACLQLKSLSLGTMSQIDWWEIFPTIVHLCTNLDELNYQDDATNSYCRFQVTRTSFFLYSLDPVPLNVLTTVVTHYEALTQVTIHCVYDTQFDAAILQLAGSCPALRQAALLVPLTGATLIEFCILRPNLAELQVYQSGEDEFTPAVLSIATQFLTGTQHHLIVSCMYVFPSDDSNDECATGLRAFALYLPHRCPTGIQLMRAAVDALPQLRVLGGGSVTTVSKQCWVSLRRKIHLFLL